MRTLAAVLVLVEHLRAYFFVAREDVAASPMTDVLYVATALGHGAVVVFFVLSGYFVGGSVIVSARAGRFAWSSYAISRLTRLWIVLIPAVAITMGCVAIGRALFPESLLYASDSSAMGDARWTDAIGNVFFLQMTFVPTLGTNAPLWSLAFEAAYYLLFPLILIEVVGRRGVRRLGGFAMVLGLALVVGWPILLLFPVWLAGAAVAAFEPRIRAWLTERPSWAVRTGRIILGALVVGCLVLDSYQNGAPTHQPPATFLLGGVTALFVALAVTDPWPRNRPGSWVLGRVSGYAHASYTLYAIHAPILMIVATAIDPVGDHRSWSPSALAWLALTGLGIAMLTVAWLLSRITEARTDDLRRWVARHLQRRGTREQAVGGASRGAD